jgi:Xaa-Pro aminopeptidase
MVPMATNLVDASLMGPAEVAWLDGYHKQVFEAVSPRVEGEVLEWLRAATLPLAAHGAA